MQGLRTQAEDLEAERSHTASWLVNVEHAPSQLSDPVSEDHGQSASGLSTGH